MEDYAERPGCIQVGRLARHSERAAAGTLHLSLVAATVTVAMVLLVSMALP